ncbi:MAG: bifunctional diaminohydroxyphosphoribosylaminopyrimidine deaminase/5-amino-6-(5-phosphoribosylamino)uracil reductase RibD [Thermodesulfobacteriota bacterium]
MQEGFSEKDREFMAAALALAARAEGATSPNPMVGAVLVKDGRIAGRGYHERAGLAHAEVAAIRNAGAEARGATLYVTLEPCNHQGRTPPCTQAVLAAGIRKVVSAMRDPNPRVAGKGLDFLASRGVEVACGLMEKEARRQNEFFIKHALTGLPFVIAKAAATWDGRTAASTGDSKWITGEQARAEVHRMRNSVDAVMVGVGTVLADDPQLTVRNFVGRVKDPVRVVLDTRLSLPLSAAVLRGQGDSVTYVAASGTADPKAREALEKAGATVLSLSEKDGRVDLGALLRELGERNIMSVLVEGGSRVLGALFRENLVDKACFFFAPKVLGGDDGFPVCAGSGPERIAGCRGLSEVSVTRFGDDVLLSGYTEKGMAVFRA